MQPGDTIKPASSTNPSGQQDSGELKIPREEPAAEASNPNPESGSNSTVSSIGSTATSSENDSSVQQSSVMPSSEPQPNSQEPAPEASWTYATQDSPQPISTDASPIIWSASEFIDHEKESSWYLALAGITIVTVGIVYFVTREILTSLAIVVAGALFGVTAKRKPHILQYELNNTGIRVGDKFHEFHAFKSFSVLDEVHFRSIQLTPFKRFAIPITLYYPPEEEVELIARLGDYLPHEKRDHDVVDKFMRKVRF